MAEEKWGNVLFTEIVGAVVFGFSIYLVALSPLSIKGSMIRTIAFAWAAYGIGAPLVILAGLEKEIVGLFSRPR